LVNLRVYLQERILKYVIRQLAVVQVTAKIPIQLPLVTAHERSERLGRSLLEQREEFLIGTVAVHTGASHGVSARYYAGNGGSVHVFIACG
jgi:hypothetical protein